MIVAIVTCVICVLFVGLLFSLVSAGGKDTLEKQAECIRKDAEDKARRKRQRAERRTRRHDKWQR